MTTPLDILSVEPDRPVFPLFITAHPDDETIQTGGLLAWLHDAEVSTHVLTCTRGELGESMPGVLPATVQREDLVRVRNSELTRALAELGVAEHDYLGTAPARANGYTPRYYVDSGMRATNGGYVPIDPTNPVSFSNSSMDDMLDDLLALVERVSPSVLVSYHSIPGEGHPDHITAHQLSIMAAERTGLPLVEVVRKGTDPSFTWFDFPAQREPVIRALNCYRSQLQVEGDFLSRVNGHLTALPLHLGMRRWIT